MQGCCIILGYFTTCKAYVYSATGLPMCLYDDRLPPQSPSSGAIPEPPPYSLDGSKQQFNELSKGVCRVVVWIYLTIFQVRGFQKEYQDRNEQHWKDVHCLRASAKCFELLVWQQYCNIFWPWASHPARLFCIADVLKKRELYLLMKIYNLKQLWYAITWTLPYEIWGAAPPNQLIKKKCI